MDETTDRRACRSSDTATGEIRRIISPLQSSSGAQPTCGASFVTVLMTKLIEMQQAAEERAGKRHGELLQALAERRDGLPTVSCCVLFRTI